MRSLGCKIKFGFCSEFYPNTTRRSPFINNYGNYLTDCIRSNRAGTDIAAQVIKDCSLSFFFFSFQQKSGLFTVQSTVKLPAICCPAHSVRLSSLLERKKFERKKKQEMA